MCGQCHVEYYFKGPEKRLTYPWDKGLKADEILAYYEENGFKDWTHAESGAPTLKAQHPEFEMWNQGVHARSGVACADCHMPYQRVGAMKISDHHVRSPLLNINRACQTCHRWSEDELRDRVHTIQDRTFQVRNIAMDALMALIADIKTARASGATDADLNEAAAPSAPRAVPARLHRGRELDGLPRGSGSGSRAGAFARRDAARSGRAAGQQGHGRTTDGNEAYSPARVPRRCASRWSSLEALGPVRE